ncbi:hypothetical protein MHBO_000815 [Bonamia ostreae]|uniref:TLC domain-containing protein n=1 Tax=Bonamia ostreae TaxID=126728 RepID=A0ABV2AH48_9EUKA
MFNLLTKPLKWALNPFARKFHDSPVININVLAAVSVILLTARYYFSKISVMKNENLKKIDNKEKTVENLWYSIYYSITTPIGFAICLKKNLYWPIENNLLDVPEAHFPPEIKYFVVFQLSFYISSLVYMVTREKRRKDFCQMVLHHINTIALIHYSVFYGFREIGVLILNVHDITDFFLYTAKYLNGVKNKLKNVCFVAFAVSYFLLRIVYYPIIACFLFNL